MLCLLNSWTLESKFLCWTYSCHHLLEDHHLNIITTRGLELRKKKMPFWQRAGGKYSSLPLSGLVRKGCFFFSILTYRKALIVPTVVDNPVGEPWKILPLRVFAREANIGNPICAGSFWDHALDYVSLSCKEEKRSVQADTIEPLSYVPSGLQLPLSTLKFR